MMLDVKNIYQKWSDIIDLTYEKQYKLEDNKKRCSELTQTRDNDFKTASEVFAKEFQINGPHCLNVSIKDGLEKFDTYILSIESLKIEKEEIITDQKLFNLPISKYEKISAVEGKLKHLAPLMDI